jgi:PTS system galactitol-specific IIA component
MKGNMMILKKELIRLAVEVADSEEALRIVAQGFVDSGYAKDTYPGAIVDRERVFATGLPAPAFDIAIPHCDSEHVIKPGVGIATLKDPVAFHMMGDPETILHPKVLFMLALTEPHGQLEMLQKLIGVIQDAELLEKIAACNDADALYGLMAPVLG